MKHIKRRIVSVRNTQQITKAMNLVAASKLQKIRARINAARQLCNDAGSMIDGAKSRESAKACKFAASSDRKTRSSAFVVMTGDRGLCGAYNTNVCKEAIAAMEGKSEKIIVLGARGNSYLTRRGKNVLGSHTGVLETAFFDDAEDIGYSLISSYLSGEVDEAYVVYTHFESMLSHVPKVVKILPIEVSEENTKDPDDEMHHDPDAAAFLDDAFPLYVDMLIYSAMVESLACEQAARMTSMDAASKNADDIIDDLTLVFNRTRQSIITQEINEIVGGANAL